jgi:outer membrane protein TolC
MQRRSHLLLELLALLVAGSLALGAGNAAAQATETTTEPAAEVDESGFPDAPEVQQTLEYESSLAASRMGGEPMELHLSDAVAQGIENNLSLQVQRFDPLIAFENQEGAWGAYDPFLSLQGGYTGDHAPNTNSLTGSSGSLRTRTRTYDAESSIDALVPWLGASLGLDVGGSRINSDAFGNFAVLRPSKESHAALTARLPLLKGLVWNEPWTRVKTSQAFYGGSREGFRRDLMDVVQRVETLYWSLVAQKQAVLVAEKSLETARSLLDQTQTQYEVGVTSRVEVVEAEAGVAAREFDLIVAVNLYRRAQDDLIDAVFGTRLTPGSHLEILPADDPENYIAYQIDTVEAAEKAFQNRPELQQAAYEIERQEFELRFAKNQRLPQLDVIGSYGIGGTRGALNNADDPETGDPILSSPFEGTYGDTYDDWFSDQGSEYYSIRGVVSIPIGNTGARHAVSARQLDLRRAKTQLTQLQQRIILEVRDGARNLASAQEGIQAAERRQAAAAEQLRAERVRLEYGESTPFRVLEKESDLVAAENQKIGALFTYRKSVVDLHRAQGTILESRNIVVDEASALR